ncbi:hypothetical protein [Sorangium sp. So ce1097]|uniref:hypothetical protein n=1 Tax=Sorangium sp. So ce1097 TaxID=3133330 RepID=UPI003F5EE60F
MHSVFYRLQQDRRARRMALFEMPEVLDARYVLSSIDGEVIVVRNCAPLGGRDDDPPRPPCR